MENRFARFMRNTGPARFFIPVGVILIVFGIILAGFKTDSYLEAVGKVTAVAEEVNTDKQKEYDVSFTYSVGGKEYQGRFDGLSKEYKEGDVIKVFYDPEDPERITNSKTGFLPLIMISAGALALVIGALKTVVAFRKSKELDETAKASAVEFEGFKQTPGVTEYYCRHDGVALKPGYILEDGAREILFEGKMIKQALVGARVFEFRDHTKGTVTEHEVGHTATRSYNDEFFSVSSWFKFDGRNIWDILHERGLRMTTNVFSRFPNLIYEVSLNGAPFAIIETSGRFVHEDEAAEQKLNIPVGRYYYRIWTDTDDIETLFLMIFAISETEQTIVE